MRSNRTQRSGPQTNSAIVYGLTNSNSYSQGMNPPQQPVNFGNICDQETAKGVAKRLFDMYDKNLNGQIEISELNPMIFDAYKAMNRSYNCGQNEAEQMQQVLDINRDEAFALRVLCGSGNQNPPARQNKYSKAIEERLEVARRLFKKFADVNGVIKEKNQISSLLKETYNNQYNPTDEDIRTWMELTDLNGDGRVTIEEFESAVIRGLEQAGIKLY